MKLLLHIGTTKTGTSTIQTFLSRNRAVLEEQGYYYPKSLGNVNHMRMAAYAAGFADAPNLFERLGVSDETGAAKLQEKIRVALVRELNPLEGVHTVIISNEHLHAQCNQKEHLTCLKDLLAPLFEHIEVLVWMRPQLDQAVSLYSTYLKHRTVHSVDQYLKKELEDPRPYFDFQYLLTLWSSVFGEGNVTARLYEKTYSLPRGVLTDFLDVSGITAKEPGFEFPERVNTSVNTTGQEILRARNQMEDLRNSRVASMNRRFNPVIEACFPGEGYVPRKKLARKFQTRFQGGNEWVRKNWFPDEKRILEPDYQKLGKSKPPDKFDYTFFTTLFQEVFAMVEETRASRVGATELRDRALAIEADDLRGAHALMTLAHELSPKRPRIKKKVAEYARKLNKKKGP